MTDSVHVQVDEDESRASSAEAKHVAPSIFYQCLAEAFGTCFIVVIGVNAVHQAVLVKGGVAGNFQVGMMFALGIMWGVYTAGSVSVLSW